ncbi:MULTISPECIES: site-2 protease family protein [Mumia]|uniref:Zinc metalloprotease n=1 Tax=Mumia xiangluensis TaxID=1678900 RepID=A0ABW1QKL2_9ACTN|nr:MULTISPECIES: site-2 protease family protein [Mumia]
MPRPDTVDDVNGSSTPPSRTRPPGTLRIGEIGGIDVLVRSSWLVVAVLIAVVLAPTIEMIAPGLGALTYVAGLAFAVLLYLSVLLHEVSHALVAKAFGYEVRSVTLNFLGGVTEIEGEPDTPGREFWIAVVGPLTSLAVGGVAWVAALIGPDTGLIAFAFRALALANLVVGVLNLLPGLPLDGGRVFRAAVWKVSGNPYAGSVAAAYGGRAVALLALAFPFVGREVIGLDITILDYVIAFVVAMFLWTGATQALVAARIRRGLPALTARGLARRAVEVARATPVVQAIEQAREAGAGAIVVHGPTGAIDGIVDERAVLATPEARRPWVEAGTLARTLSPGLTLPVDIAGEALIRALQRTPSTEYLVIDGDRLYGVLVMADVDKAFAEHVRTDRQSRTGKQSRAGR